MVFLPQNLLLRATIGDGNGDYTYVTADAVADINTSGYFNDVSDTLIPGDLITVVQKSALSDPAATVTAASIMIVLTNAAGVVDVSDGLSIPVADAD